MKINCPLDSKEISKEINTEYSLEGLMLKQKLQYFGHLMQRANLLEKTQMLGKIEGRSLPPPPFLGVLFQAGSDPRRCPWVWLVNNSRDGSLSPKKVRLILEPVGYLIPPWVDLNHSQEVLLLLKSGPPLTILIWILRQDSISVSRTCSPGVCFLGSRHATIMAGSWWRNRQTARPLEGQREEMTAGLPVCRELCGEPAPGSFTAAGLGDENPIFR